jgi:A/G-specific adenine glycosylase
MLQQTQAARVVPYYERFAARFPTPSACAAEPVAAVVRVWHGLGYNRRAVSLHAAAAAVVERHGGHMPADLDALQALPGVGRYTARAVLAFAYERDVGVVEVNTARVLARGFAGRRLAAREAQALADAVVPAGHGWAWNQAMLDLGATVCTKRAPACGRCPIRRACAWAASGRRTRDPADGSAGTGRPQSRFEGSDRQGRGRLVAALRAGPVALAEVAEAAGWGDDPARAARALDGLVADGLAVMDGTTVRLP